MEKIFQSRKFKIVALAIGAFILAILIFAAGAGIGFRKARFSYEWGRNYERNFTGPHPEMNGPLGPMGMMREGLRDFEGRDFRNAHGLAGTIISISENNIIVKDRDNKENTIAVTDKTIIKSGRDDIKISDLKNDEQIVVMGKPGENGVINAELIRVFNNNTVQ